MITGFLLGVYITGFVFYLVFNMGFAFLGGKMEDVIFTFFKSFIWFFYIIKWILNK